MPHLIFSSTVLPFDSEYGADQCRSYAVIRGPIKKVGLTVWSVCGSGIDFHRLNMRQKRKNGNQKINDNSIVLYPARQ